MGAVVSAQTSNMYVAVFRYTSDHGCNSDESVYLLSATSIEEATGVARSYWLRQEWADHTAKLSVVCAPSCPFHITRVVGPFGCCGSDGRYVIHTDEPSDLAKEADDLDNSEEKTYRIFIDENIDDDNSGKFCTLDDCRKSRFWIEQGNDYWSDEECVSFYSSDEQDMDEVDEPDPGTEAVEPDLQLPNDVPDGNCTINQSESQHDKLVKEKLMRLETELWKHLASVAKLREEILLLRKSISPK